MERPTKSLRRRLRRLTPDWLAKRLLPFESELVRLAHEFCATPVSRGPVLDLGCGAGKYAEWKAIGLDKDWEVLVHQEGLRVCADAHQLPFRGGSLQAICCSAAFHHFRRPEAVLSEMRRCLPAQGRIFLTIPDRFPRTDQTDDFHRFRREQIVSLLETDGWFIEECSPIGGRWWLLSRLSLEKLCSWTAGMKLTLFLAAAPILGLVVPLSCFYLDRGDAQKQRTLGWRVIARKEVE